MNHVTEPWAATRGGSGAKLRMTELAGTRVRSSRSTSPRTTGPASCETLPGTRRPTVPPEPLRRPQAWLPPFMAPLTLPSAAYDLVRFFRSSSTRQPGLLIAHVDHMRMTSISSNDESFTCHLHIRRRSTYSPTPALHVIAWAPARPEPRTGSSIGWPMRHGRSSLCLYSYFRSGAACRYGSGLGWL